MARASDPFHVLQANYVAANEMLVETNAPIQARTAAPPRGGGGRHVPISDLPD